MVGMAGGMGHKEGALSLGERAGLPAQPRPWETLAGIIEPRNHHVWVYLVEEWVQAFAIELARDADSSWRVKVAYSIAPGHLHYEWVPQSRVRVMQ